MHSPTPILFTIPNFITAGSGRAMVNIIERLDRARFAPAVCVMQKGGDLDQVVEKMGIPLIEARFAVPPRPVYQLPFQAWKAAQVFRPYGFKLWHSFHYLDDYTEPIIARLAGARAWLYTKKAMGWGSRSWLVRSYLSTRIVTNNSEMPSLMFDHIGLRGNTRVIHRGVLVDRFRPDVPPRLGIRERLNLTPDESLVACVAHLVPVKGHPTLLRAMAMTPGAHLAVVGNPTDREYFSTLKQMVRDLGISDRTHFLGPIKDVPALLAEVDVFVLPTWARWRMEGCPVALLEAMACGRACIATDIPGSRELIEPGKSGLIVAPEDSGALAIAINRLVGSSVLRRLFGKEARARILTHFTIDKEAAAHDELYSELLFNGRHERNGVR